MIKGNDASDREEKIAELVMLFSSLQARQREVVMEIARIMSERNKGK